MELIDVTESDAALFPHTGVLSDGLRKTPDPRSGHGRVLQCSECGTRLRTGQPHTGLEPIPHTSLDALTVIEALPKEEW